MNLRQLPNVITGIRMLLVVPVVWSLCNGRYTLALVLVLAAGVSDAIDGWLAKHFGWRTRLGSLLDPVADKLLLLGCFAGLWLVGAVPAWLTALVIGRDLLIVSGAVAYHNVIDKVQGDPTLISKATTVAQITLVLILLGGLAIQPLPQGWTVLMQDVIAVLTAASGLDYVVRWSRRAWLELREKRGI